MPPAPFGPSSSAPPGCVGLFVIRGAQSTATGWTVTASPSFATAPWPALLEGAGAGVARDTIALPVDAASQIRIAASGGCRVDVHTAGWIDRRGCDE